MSTGKTHAVTGAFGFSGKYTAKLLLAKEHKVITLTGNPERSNPFGDQVNAFPFQFDEPDAMASNLRGVEVLYNSYWIRFSHKKITFEDAVKNTRALVDAAKLAGVRKIVHISITNPDANSALPYFRGKAQVEQLIQDSGLSYTFLRPAVIFGTEGILINNIAWMLKLFPILPIPGDGEYKLQPIFVGDLAKLAVESGEIQGNQTIDAIGPETFTYNEMLHMMAGKLGLRARTVHLPPGLAYLFSKPLGYLLGDVILTKDEVTGLLNNTLTTDSKPAGSTKLSDWVADNAATLGAKYLNELKMHY